LTDKEKATSVAFVDNRNNVVLPIAGNKFVFVFWCEGCGHCHFIDTRRWVFNRDLIKPTVSPSLLNYAVADTPRCHLFVRDGQLQYLGDCTHDLAGKTVDMIPPRDILFMRDGES